MIEAIFAAVGVILIFFLCVTIVVGAIFTYYENKDFPIDRDDDEDQLEFIREWHKNRNKNKKR